MKLQFHLLLVVLKDIVTIGGKLNGAYARNAGRSYTKPHMAVRDAVFIKAVIRFMSTLVAN